MLSIIPITKRRELRSPVSLWTTPFDWNLGYTVFFMQRFGFAGGNDEKRKERKQ